MQHSLGKPHASVHARLRSLRSGSLTNAYQPPAAACSRQPPPPGATATWPPPPAPGERTAAPSPARPRPRPQQPSLPSSPFPPRHSSEHLPRACCDTARASNPLRFCCRWFSSDKGGPRNAARCTVEVAGDQHG